MKRLIVNADDFGMDDGVVRGIIDLHQAGLVTSTSCMTNKPAWPQAAAYLRAHPELGAGVHLTFNDGQPVLPAAQVPALLGKDGRFMSDGQILRSLRPGTTSQLRAEFRAQIERFVADVGRPPDHLDNHCAVSYVRPDRFRVTLELAQGVSLCRSVPPLAMTWRRWCRSMRATTSCHPGSIRWQGTRYRARVDRAGIRRPNTFIQHFSMEGNRTPEYLLSVLDGLRDGWVSELLAHPGYGGGWREQDLRALLDPRVKARLERAGYRARRLCGVVDSDKGASVRDLGARPEIPWRRASSITILPPELIAQTPVEPRDASRLMVVHRSYGRASSTAPSATSPATSAPATCSS